MVGSVVIGKRVLRVHFRICHLSLLSLHCIVVLLIIGMVAMSSIAQAKLLTLDYVGRVSSGSPFLMTMP
jgi:hypothetical protein